MNIRERSSLYKGNVSYFIRQKCHWQMIHSPSEGLGEMFEGDSADMFAGKFPLVSMGVERTVSRAQTREGGPHRR